MSVRSCITCVVDIIELQVACELCQAGDFIQCAQCIREAYTAWTRCTACVDTVWDTIKLAVEQFLGVKPMACVNTHSTKVQGLSVCCAQVGTGLLPPPPGTILPVYTPGSEASFQHVQVTDGGGHCGTCMIVGSKSKKHPGTPVLKFIRGGIGCPTTRTGCCSLATL